MQPGLREQLRGEVDAVWAERIRLLPMAQGGPDAGRAPEEIHAILRTGDREGGFGHRGRAERGRADLVSGGGTLRIDRTAHPALILRGRDKIVALDRPGEPVFEIVSVDDRSHLRLVCALGDAS